MRFCQIENIISIISVIITAGVCAFSGATFFIQRKHNRKCVRPLLNVLRKELPLSICLSNKGIGPAIISGVKIKKGNKEIYESIEDFIKENSIIASEKYFSLNINSSNRITVAAGETIILFQLYPNDKQDKQFDEDVWAKFTSNGCEIMLNFEDVYEKEKPSFYKLSDVPLVQQE